MIASCAIFSACDKSNGEPKEIEPVTANEELSAFIEKYFAGDFSLWPDDNDDKCVMVNSMEEFENIFSSSVELPAINFDRYTLIVGRHQMATTGHRVVNQSITVRSQKTELNLIVEIPTACFPMVSPMYYVGLYPKLPRTSVEVNFTFKYSDSKPELSDDYYWGSTGKIPIQKSDGKYFVMFCSADGEKLRNELSMIGEIGDTQDYNITSFYDGNISYFSVELEVNDITPLIKLDEVIYAAPYYIFEDGKEFPLTNVFYVGLQNPSTDITLLEELAENYDVDIVEKIPLTDAVYVLSCTKNSTGNTLEMANLFYETGLFLHSIPEFLSAKTD